MIKIELGNVPVKDKGEGGMARNISSIQLGTKRRAGQSGCKSVGEFTLNMEK